MGFVAVCGNKLEPFEVRFFADDYISLVDIGSDKR